MKRTGILSVAGFALAVAAYAGDWPQFCGPTRNNISAETGLADSWPEAGPKVLWETAVTGGYAGPTIKDGKAYLVDRDGEKSVLRCLDMTSGEELWKCAFSDPGEMKGKKYEGTRGIPTLTDDAAYLVTGYGTFACIDLQSHEVKWKHVLTQDFDIKLPQFGIAQSPFIHGDMVLVAPNAKSGSVAAYDKKSGKRLWVSPALGTHAYVSPQVVTLCGQEMVLAVSSTKRPPKAGRGRPNEAAANPDADDEAAPAESGRNEAAPAESGRVAGLSLTDGSILWDYTGWRCSTAVPGPTPLGNDRLFITGGYEAGSAIIQIEKNTDGFKAKELCKIGDIGAQVHQPIMVGSHVFVVGNTNKRNDGLCCFDLDGKLVWRTKDVAGAPKFERGPFILADGKFIMLDGKSGILYLVSPDVSGYKQLASAKMVKENVMSWAPLALSNGKLLVRDWTTLKCVDLK